MLSVLPAKVTHFNQPLHTHAVISYYMYVTDGYLCYHNIGVINYLLANVTEYKLLKLPSVIGCYRGLPILYAVYTHTQVCICTLPMLSNVTECYRFFTNRPVSVLPMIPSVIQYYRVLSMLPIWYVVYTHTHTGLYNMCLQFFPYTTSMSHRGELKG